MSTMPMHRMFTAASKQMAVAITTRNASSTAATISLRCTLRSTRNVGGVVIPSQRSFVAEISRPTSAVTKETRLALRAARKERAARVLQQAKGVDVDGASSTTTSAVAHNVLSSKYMWYASVLVPSAILVWGFSDTNSPPAKVSRWIGLTGWIASFADEIAKPSHDKLLPDWSQVRVCIVLERRICTSQSKLYSIVLYFLIVCFATIPIYFVDAQCSTRHSCPPYPCFGFGEHIG